MAIVEFEVFRDHLGVGTTDPEVDEVSKLYDAIGSEIVRLTRRRYEGDEGATYDQVLRIRGAHEFQLPYAPVAAITSIAAVTFDGEVSDAYDADRYRLEDADRGLVRLRPSVEYARVVWTVTGAIPADVVQAYLDWGKDRWSQRDQVAGLASYSTGQDSESYSVTLAGRPSRSVLLALLGNAHYDRGGVV